MGWLFAVTRGLQEGNRRAVFGALILIVIGHEASAVLVVGAIASQELVASHTVRLLGALALVSVGVYRLSRPRMTSAHGTVFMLVPVLLGWPVLDQLPAANYRGALLIASSTCM